MKNFNEITNDSTVKTTGPKESKFILLSKRNNS